MVKDPETEGSTPLGHVGHFLQRLRGVRVSGPGRREGGELAGEQTGLSEGLDSSPASTRQDLSIGRGLFIAPCEGQAWKPAVKR